MSNIFWTAYSNDERHSAISKIQNVISKYGDLVDTTFYSDISLNLRIEMEERRVDELYKELSQNMRIDHFDFLNSTVKKERTVFLNVTFSKGTGNLKIAVPSVPG